MGRLFWKFFLSILLAQVAATIGIGGTLWLRDQAPPAQQRADPGHRPARHDHARRGRRHAAATAASTPCATWPPAAAACACTCSTSRATNCWAARCRRSCAKKSSATCNDGGPTARRGAPGRRRTAGATWHSPRAARVCAAWRRRWRPRPARRPASPALASVTGIGRGARPARMRSATRPRAGQRAARGPAPAAAGSACRRNSAATSAAGCRSSPPPSPACCSPPCWPGISRARSAPCAAPSKPPPPATWRRASATPGSAWPATSWPNWATTSTA